MSIEPIPKAQRAFQLGQTFTPAAPVARHDLFSGRFDQVISVTTALGQPGRQVVLYGERGVGKTSLANVLSDLVFAGDGESKEYSVVRFNCTTQDNFGSIWMKAMRAAGIDPPENWRHVPPDPDEIRVMLQAPGLPLAIVMDEFDRVEDDDALSLMADTVKALADHAVRTKLVIVGVATSIDQLIGEHESILRNIEQVLMPRMTQDEMSKIIDTGLQVVNMSIEPEARRRITKLAEGLPHFVHLLALNSSKSALADDREVVTVADVNKSAREAVQSHSLVKDYQTAIQSPRPNNLFARVLLSCALADKNLLGQFTAADVRGPMSKIMGSPYDIPAFAPHLKAFTEIDRGSILVQEGRARRYTYRFRNPLLQPFTVLTSMRDDLIPTDYLADLFSDADDGPSLI